MKPPSSPSTKPGNHGPHTGSICKKTCPQQPQPGKLDDFTQPENYSRSSVWEFFTADSIFGSEMRAQQTLFRFNARDERRDENGREQHADEEPAPSRERR